MKYDAVVKTPIGKVGIRVADGCVTSVDFNVDARVVKPTDAVAKAAVASMFDYFLEARQLHDVPVSLSGTDFQQRVWAALQQIKPGQVETYGELAKRLGSAPRAVGQACRKNPCPILIPCHRVVSATGIGGFAGETEGGNISMKRWLLRHEGVAC